MSVVAYAITAGLTQAMADAVLEVLVQVDSVVALRQLPEPTTAAAVYLTGYYSPGDGGQSPLIWVPTSTKADNGGTVFRPDTSPVAGRWERDADRVDPRWFGAKSTDIVGEFDNTAAIQAALDNCRCVCLPAHSTFKIDGRLTIPSGTTLMGNGRDSELLFTWVGRDLGFTEYIRNETQSSDPESVIDTNIVLRDFKLTGSGDGLPYGSPIPGNTGTTVSGILMRRVSNLVIEGLEITKVTGISIAYQGCQNPRIFGNYIHDVGRDGITGCWWIDRLEDVTVQSNTIENNGDDGIAIISSEDQPNTDVRPRRVSIVGNVIKTRDDYLGSTQTVSVTASSAVATATSGTPFTSADVAKRIVIPGAGAAGVDFTGWIISVDSSTQITLNAVVSTTVASATAKYSNVAGRGILCIGGEDITISGNVIEKTAMAGILVYADESGSLFRPRKIAITGNTIIDAGRSGDDTQPGNAIRMSNCDDSTICGNTLNNSRQSGIYVSDCVSPAINGNVIAVCGSSCVAGKFHYGIEVYGNPASYNVLGPSILGNTVRGCAAGGILNSFSRHASVGGNVCVDNGALGDGTRHEASGIMHLGNGEGAYSGNSCSDYKGSGSKLQVFGFAYLAGYDGAKLFLSGNVFSANKNVGINLTANPTYISLSSNYSPEGFNLGSLTGTAACVKRGNIESATAANNFDRDAGSTGTTHRTGSGTPEGAITATIGSTYRRSDGGAGTTFYVKESGAGNTGWAAK